jgi:hypothetical protein
MLSRDGFLAHPVAAISPEINKHQMSSFITCKGCPTTDYAEPGYHPVLASYPNGSLQLMNPFGSSGAFLPCPKRV